MTCSNVRTGNPLFSIHVALTLGIRGYCAEMTDFDIEEASLDMELGKHNYRLKGQGGQEFFELFARFVIVEPTRIHNHRVQLLQFLFFRKVHVLSHHLPDLSSVVVLNL